MRKIRLRASGTGAIRLRLGFRASVLILSAGAVIQPAMPKIAPGTEVAEAPPGQALLLCRRLNRLQSRSVCGCCRCFADCSFTDPADFNRRCYSGRSLTSNGRSAGSYQRSCSAETGCFDSCFADLVLNCDFQTGCRTARSRQLYNCCRPAHDSGNFLRRPILCRNRNNILP